jgi:hypothetical protein
MLSEPVKTNVLEIHKYSDKYKDDWNDLVAKSRNGTFLMNRDYMDYHKERFSDCSFVFLKKDRIEAILPGNISNNTFHSHQGLTYGGLIMSDKITSSDVLEIFELLNIELKKLLITEVIYKPVPSFYHRYPAQEDIYALHLLGAEKIGCNLSSAIYQKHHIGFSELRKRGLKRGIKAGIRVAESNNYSAFWAILNENLSRRYSKVAVHSEQEIKLLSSRFHNYIRLYTAQSGDEIIAGVVTFRTPHAVHVQYIAANETGRELGALDVIFSKLINDTYSNIPVFEFGQSTEQMGAYLNKNLIFQKEGFGARGVVYEIYKYRIAI